MNKFRFQHKLHVWETKATQAFFPVTSTTSNRVNRILWGVQEKKKKLSPMELQVLGSTFLSKGEQPLDRVKQAQKYASESAQQEREAKAYQETEQILRQHPKLSKIQELIYATIHESEPLRIKSPYTHKMDEILRNPGCALEWFFVDTLKRYFVENKPLSGVSFLHSKTSSELDKHLKVDFQTRLRFQPGKILESCIDDEFMKRLILKRNKMKDRYPHLPFKKKDIETEVFQKIEAYKEKMKSRTRVIRMGIQLTTIQSNAIAEHHRSSKIMDIGTRARRIDKKAQEKMGTSPGFTPDTLAFLTINSEINQSINRNLETRLDKNVFRSAFNAWAQAEFPPGGPSEFLPDNIKKDLLDSAAEYLESLASYIETMVLFDAGFMGDTLEIGRSKQKNKEDLYISTEYRSDLKSFDRACYKSEDQLLMRLSVFTSPQMEKIFPRFQVRES